MSVFSKVYEEQMAKIEEHEQFRNKQTYMFIRQLFTTMVISSFEWDGEIPDFIKTNPDFIEESLFGAGKIAACEHNGERLIAPCYANGTLSKSGLYSNYTLIFRNGEMLIKPREEVELCFNNCFHAPSRIMVDEMIENCVRALRAVDTSLLRAQLPAIFALGDETKIATMVSEIDKSYKMNKPYSLISGDWLKDELKKFDVYDNRATDILALWDVFVRYKNLVFTTFGVNNVEITKTERLTLQESQSNTEITRYGMFNDMFKHRKDFCERVKNHFGWNLTVNVNRNYDTVTELNMTPEDKMEMQEKIITPYAEKFQNEGVEENDDKEEN